MGFLRAFGVLFALVPVVGLGDSLFFPMLLGFGVEPSGILKAFVVGDGVKASLLATMLSSPKNTCNIWHSIVMIENHLYKIGIKFFGYEDGYKL
jgi:hypothetical protein